jgi:hypothetical protein
VNRHTLLSTLHRLLEPRTYLEIGVREGKSLALARCRTIAVDPFFKIDREVLCDLHLVRTTSDEFFARKHPLAHFDEPLVDLAFIDGMHLAEYALRDIINVERFTHPGSVVVIDDMLPRTVDEAGRTRQGTARNGAWAGDVFKVIRALREHRPDLVVLELDTTPTGTLVLMSPDARSTALKRVYDDLVERFVVPDPQVVDGEILSRSRAVDPRAFVRAPLWKDVVAVRDQSRQAARERVLEALARTELWTPGRVSA